jgi:ATP-dependent RNA helicase DDX46/PRP5
VADIQEHYECAVTVRGQYVAPGKKAPEGVRPLYIVLEADSERKIQMAKAEVKRILKEEMAKAANWGPGAFGQSKGRYAITFG